ncbi:MAG: SpoIID/LytB domain-containing protein [Thermanaerothrix sp.]|nr:SpoIID/LytB domain-containing protein [Thermanaerothrix sp.]
MAVLVCSFCSTLEAQTLLRVGVALNVANGTLGGVGSITDSSGTSLPLSGRVSVTAGDGGVWIQGRFLRFPIRIGGDNLSFGPIGYRGGLELIPSRGGRGFNVVNLVELEDYLRGIMKAEANPGWPMEFLKAQAVVARTYALRNLGRHRSDGFDICSSLHCQVYRGRNGEDPRSDQAVFNTSGMVLMYGSSLAITPFHSDSGGVTAAASDVWGGRVPYLLSRPEPFQYRSPYSRWKTILSSDQIERALRSINRWVGNVVGIKVVARDRGGRITAMDINGSSGTVRLSGHAFRMALGTSVVRSTNFIVNGNGKSDIPSNPAVNRPVEDDEKKTDVSYETDPLVEMVEDGLFSKDEIFDMIVNPSKRDMYKKMGEARVKSGTSNSRKTGAERNPVATSSASIRPSSGNTSWVLEGQGWGHGVGMSQWGAKTMAEYGWNFEQILMYYFPGTHLGRR